MMMMMMGQLLSEAANPGVEVRMYRCWQLLILASDDNTVSRDYKQVCHECGRRPASELNKTGQVRVR